MRIARKADVAMGPLRRVGRTVENDKTIWIVNHYAGGMAEQHGGRHYWFAKYLKRAGYEPVIFCSNARHGERGSFYGLDGIWEEHVAEEIGVPFVYVKSREYSDNGKQRILNMVDFYRNVKTTMREYAKLHGRPSIIIGSSVHPLAVAAAEEIAKKLKVPCICEVRDLWPFALVEYGYLREEGQIAQRLYRFEHRLYERADAIIFTMEGGRRYIVDRGWDKEHGGSIDLQKIHYINNGVDLEAFDANRERYMFEDDRLEKSSYAKIVYAGSIRRVNHLGYLLDVAELMRDEQVDFVIIGDGDEREMLEKDAQRRDLGNVYFVGKIGKQYVPSALRYATVCTALCDPVAQGGVARYGNSNNKVFEYLASGRPLITNSASEHSFINDGDCGTEGDFATPEEYAAALREMLDDSEGLERWGKNARRVVRDYSFERHTDKLMEIIEGLTASGKGRPSERRWVNR